ACSRFSHLLKRNKTWDTSEGEETLLHRVVKKAFHLSNVILTRDERYEICDIPDSTAEYDQLAIELLKQGEFVKPGVL
ncbi:hypothetical protein, partial [Corynebacterium flavescens]|uniref:hypothetical protein n=1 Tax=Corynebacterium flavescens TaxID=28028 RepID=UPI0026470446